MRCAIRRHNPRMSCGPTCDRSISRCGDSGIHGHSRSGSANSSANSVEWRQRPPPRRPQMRWETACPAVAAGREPSTQKAREPAPALSSAGDLDQRGVLRNRPIL